MADTPALAPEHGYYQRLLARDQAEAADLIERCIKTAPERSVYDACCCRRSITPNATVWSSGCRWRKKRPSSMRRGNCCRTPQSRSDA
mgnify:CR=1 FL=1